MRVNYAKAVKAQQKQNLKLVTGASPDQRMRAKIKREAKRIQASERAILHLYQKSPTFRKYLAPKASRQSVHETAFFEALVRTFGKDSVVKLPSSGKNALYLEKGKVVSQSKKSPWNLSKSVDFMVEVEGTKFYICHKYTKQEGGSQDNQYADIQSVMLQGRGCQKGHVIAVCDGEYYTPERMAHLNKHFTTKRVHVCTSEVLDTLIASLV